MIFAGVFVASLGWTKRPEMPEPRKHQEGCAAGTTSEINHGHGADRRTRNAGCQDIRRAERPSEKSQRGKVPGGRDGTM